MTIMGACTDGPCVIDGKGMGQIFVVGISGTLTLKNLEITGGMCSEGSAVLVAGNVLGGGGRLLALNVLFYNNTASVTHPPPPPQNSSIDLHSACSQVLHFISVKLLYNMKFSMEP